MLFPETTTEDYRNAPGGDGPMAGQWADKPHRLIYDLCGEVERLKAVVDKLDETADCVPYTPDMIVYAWYRDKIVTSSHESRHHRKVPRRPMQKIGPGTYLNPSWCKADGFETVAVFEIDYGIGIPIDQCYSTYEAAETAKEDKQ